MSRHEKTMPFGPSGRHAVEFCAAMQKAYGFRPSLNLIEAGPGAEEVSLVTTRHGVRVVFPLETEGLAGEMTLPVERGDAGAPDPDIVLSIVPLARKMLDTELYDQRLRRQVAELNRRNARLELRARHDPHTGLLNHKAFRAFVEARLRALKPGTQAALVLVDLDDFKGVNDTHGHAFGDKYLDAFARSLTLATRRDDLVGRLGGDEFGVFFEKVPLGELFLKEFTARIRRRFGVSTKPLKPKAPRFASLGAAIVSVADIGYQSLFDAADTALYASKLNGRDQLTVTELKRA